MQTVRIVTTQDWFEVGTVRLGKSDSLRVEVTQRRVRLTRDGHWSLSLPRSQAMRLSDLMDSAIAWWPPQRVD